jgi:hypothetical protein
MKFFNKELQPKFIVLMVALIVFAIFLMYVKNELHDPSYQSLFHQQKQQEKDLVSSDNYNSNNCNLISSLSFQSTNEQETRNGVGKTLMRYWTIEFPEGDKVYWNHFDGSQAGTYACKNNVLQIVVKDRFGSSRSTTAIFDNVTGVLILDGVEYKRDEIKTTSQDEFWFLRRKEGKLQSININTGAVTDWLTYPGQGPNSDNIILMPRGNITAYFNRIGDGFWSLVMYDLHQKKEYEIAEGVRCLDGPCPLADQSIAVGDLSLDGKYLSFYEKGKSYLFDTKTKQKFLIDDYRLVYWQQQHSTIVDLTKLTAGKVIGNAVFPNYEKMNPLYFVNDSKLLLNHEYINNSTGSKLVTIDLATDEKKIILEDVSDILFLLGPKE